MRSRPTAPGNIIKYDVLEPMHLSIAEAARRLGVSRASLSRVVNGKAGISAGLALRLEKAGVSTARTWLAMQANYELWLAMQHERPKVRALQIRRT
jgi:addiction module HigA family antidote